MPHAARSGQAGVSAGDGGTAGPGGGRPVTRLRAPSPPGFIDSQISLQSGQTGNFSGARLGTQTLPHRATTGVPITIASVSLCLST